MLPRHQRGRVSSRILVAGRWVRPQGESDRIAIFGRDEVNRINQVSRNERQAAARATMARLLA